MRATKQGVGRRAPAWIAGAVVSACGLIAFAAFCRMYYGDALYFSHVQTFWGRQFSVLGPWRALIAFRFDPDYYVVTIAAIVGRDLDGSSGLVGLEPVGVVPPAGAAVHRLAQEYDPLSRRERAVAGRHRTRSGAPLVPHRARAVAPAADLRNLPVRGRLRAQLMREIEPPKALFPR